MACQQLLMAGSIMQQAQMQTQTQASDTDSFPHELLSCGMR